jgi:hypothetical protein
MRHLLFCRSDSSRGLRRRDFRHLIAAAQDEQPSAWPSVDKGTEPLRKATTLGLPKRLSFSSHDLALRQRGPPAKAKDQAVKWLNIGFHRRNGQ